MKRWNVLNNPFGFIPRQEKPIIHPVVESFEDFNEKQKKDLLHIKNIISNKIQEFEIYVFGSQIKGNWDENSDYDILVKACVNEEDKKELRKYNYGIKVDLNFTKSTPLENIVKT
jgi:predicted nucleotidyltransferase